MLDTQFAFGVPPAAPRLVGEVGAEAVGRGHARPVPRPARRRCVPERGGDLVPEGDPGLGRDHHRGDPPAVQPLEQRAEHRGAVAVHREGGTVRRRAPPPGRTDLRRVRYRPPGAVPGRPPEVLGAPGRRARRPEHVQVEGPYPLFDGLHVQRRVHRVPGRRVRPAQPQQLGRRHGVPGPAERHFGPGSTHAGPLTGRSRHARRERPQRRRIRGQLAHPAVRGEHVHPRQPARELRRRRQPEQPGGRRARRGRDSDW